LRVPTIEIILNNLCIIPIIIGAIKFNRLDYCFRLLMFDIIMGFIADFHILNEVLLKTPILYNLTRRTYSVIDAVLLFMIYQFWLKKNSFNRLKALLFILILVAIIDGVLFGISGFRASLIDILYPFIVVIFSIMVFVDLVLEKNNEHKISKLLIVIPQIVFYSYFLIMTVLLFFLYNKSNQHFFNRLYSPIKILNAICSVSYSIALIWLPKKERFL